MAFTNDIIRSYKNMYVESFYTCPSELDGVFNVTIKEDDPEAKLKKVTISNVPENTILINLQEYTKLNTGNQMKKIIKDETGVFKCCDYLLAAMDIDKLHLVYIEMKSKEFMNKEIVEQFCGASCFMEYCNAVLEYFYGKTLDNHKSIITSYALLSYTNFMKTSTKPNVAKKNKYRKSMRPESFVWRKIGNLYNIPYKWFIMSE